MRWIQGQAAVVRLVRKVIWGSWRSKNEVVEGDVGCL